MCVFIMILIFLETKVHRDLPVLVTFFNVSNALFERLLCNPVIFIGSLQGRITTQGDPCNLYREEVCSVALGEHMTFI